jgi:hypothetical protein
MYILAPEMAIGAIANDISNIADFNTLKEIWSSSKLFGEELHSSIGVSDEEHMIRSRIVDLYR